MAEVVTETIVKAPPERAWQGWVDPVEMAQWWWPMFADTAYDLDVRVGGGYRIESVAAGIGARGTYVEVVPHQRLVMTWVWLSDGTDDGPEDTVTVTFDAVDEGTQVKVVHATRPEGTDDYRQGWQDCLDRLATLTS